MFKYLCKRLSERSTWLGLIAFATACGVELEVALTEQIIAAGVALAGLVGILTKDQQQETATGEKPAADAAEAGKEESHG